MRAFVTTHALARWRGRFRPGDGARELLDALAFARRLTPAERAGAARRFTRAAGHWDGEARYLPDAAALFLLGPARGPFSRPGDRVVITVVYCPAGYLGGRHKGRAPA